MGADGVVTEPEAWLYDRFARFLDPGDYDPEQGLVRGLSTNLAHSRKPGTRMRIGLGSGVLVTERGVTVAADVVPSKPPPGDIKWSSLDRLSSYRMATEVLLDPPDPPFLFVAFGKKPDVRASLRISVSRDVVELCGDGAMTVRRRPVMAAYEQLQDVPLAVFRTLSALVYHSGRDPRSASIKAAIERTVAKHGALGQRALDAALHGPRRETSEYAALSRLLTARDKLAKVSSGKGAAQ